MKYNLQNTTITSYQFGLDQSTPVALNLTDEMEGPIGAFPVQLHLNSNGASIQAHSTADLGFKAATQPLDATNFILRIEDVPGESKSIPMETVSMNYTAIETGYDTDVPHTALGSNGPSNNAPAPMADSPTVSVSFTYAEVENRYEEFDTQSAHDDTPYDASVPKEFRADLPPPPFEALDTTSDEFHFVQTTTAGDADIFVPDAMVLTPEGDTRDESGLPDTIIWCLDGDGTSTGPDMIDPIIDDFAWG